MALDLKGPDVDSAPRYPVESCPALIGGKSRDEGIAAGVDRRAAGEQSHRLRRPAIVRQRREMRIDQARRTADEIVVGSAADESRVGPVAKEVVGTRRIGGAPEPV